MAEDSRKGWGFSGECGRVSSDLWNRIHLTGGARRRGVEADLASSSGLGTRVRTRRRRMLMGQAWVFCLRSRSRSRSCSWLASSASEDATRLRACSEIEWSGADLPKVESSGADFSEIEWS
eukprot:128707-Pleurochrysis_carterae.AAC.1